MHLELYAELYTLRPLFVLLHGCILMPKINFKIQWPVQWSDGKQETCIHPL